MPTAILIDGAFFIKKFRKLDPTNSYNAKKVAKVVHESAMQHLHQKDKTGVDRALYRIFFYDCPPIDYKGHNPISKKAVDLTKTDEYRFRLELHNELRKVRKLALRLGRLRSINTE